MNTEPCSPVCPVRAVATPGTSWSSGSSDGAARSSMRSRSSTSARDAERRQRGLAARGAHDHALARRARARGRGRAGSRRRRRAPSRARAARGRARRRTRRTRRPRARRRGSVPSGPVVTTTLAGRAVEGDGDAGEREAVARADDAGERPGGASRPSRTRADERTRRSQTTEKGEGGEGKPSASSREKPLARRSGQVSWLPGHRLAPDLPRVSPSGGALQAPLGAGSPATVAGPRRPSTCFPFTLPQREAP